VAQLLNVPYPHSLRAPPAYNGPSYHKNVKLFRLFPLCCAALLMAQAPDPAGTARKAVDLFLGAKYADLNQMFAPAYKEAYSEQALTKLGETAKAYGAVEKIGEPGVRDMGPVSAVTIPVQFSKQSMNFTVYINAAGQVAQMYMGSGQTSWSRPDYSKSGAFQARDVMVGNDEWKLPGTFTYPTGKTGVPAVVLVPDSGPSDRDATVVATKVFRDLAEGLSSRGIAVLRYEKRTRQYAAKMSTTSYTIDEETVHDASQAVALARTEPEVDPKRVYVLGFGVGGYIAPRIAADDGKLAGLILLGAPEHSLEDWILETAQSLAGVTPKLLADLKVEVSKIKKFEANDADLPPQLGFPVAYWLDLKGYDPAGDAKKLGIAMLILQGGRDFQVAPVEFDAWKTAMTGRNTVTLKSYPSLNHLFVAGEGKSNEQEYRKPGHVSPEVIDDIVKFVNP
jgi:dienelactone hydrolase